MVANSTALFIKLSSCPAPAVGIQRCHLDAWEVADVHYGQLAGDGGGGDVETGHLGYSALNLALCFLL